MATYESAVVRLIAPATDTTAGLGVLTGTRQVVTCAHVVNAALGLGLRSQAPPAATRRLQVEFPLVPGAPVRAATVAVWVPAAVEGTGGGDIAGLALAEDAPSGVRHGRFAAGEAAPGEVLRAFGYPGMPPRRAGLWVDVDVKGRVGGQLIQVESRGDQTIKAQPGYSGTPVWRPDTGEVVGLLHATAFADEPYRDAYLLPPLTIAEAWEEQFDYLLIPPNPYRGLEPFTAEHSDVFFGRKRDVEALTARVTDQSVVVVAGSSGVGKSSLVQAGLIPHLQAADSWSVALVRLGKDPWYRLAAGLLRARRPSDDPSAVGHREDDIEREAERIRAEGFGATARLLRSVGRRLLIVIDQFEELLAVGRSLDPALLGLLLPSAGESDDATRLVITLRADYLPALLRIPGVGFRLDQRLYLLSPLAEEQVHDAIERPALKRGVRFEPGLIDQIVRDTGTESLPLLEFTLTRLWGTQRHKILRFTGYQVMGGVDGALDRFAEQQVAELGGISSDVVDRVLLRLVNTPTGDPRLTTRQRVLQTAVSSPEWEAIQHLADARLVMVGTDVAQGPYAELAHEALITSWQRLHRLVAENVEFLGWLDGIRRRAAEGDPLPEARIAEARRWLDARSEEIPDPIKTFVDNSQTSIEARLRELTEARIRAENALRQMEAAARRADALRLAADSELALRSSRGGTAVALPLAVESLLAEPSLQGDLALRHVLRLHPSILTSRYHDGAVWGVAFAPDGSRVATGSMDGSARVFEVATGAELARLDHDDTVWMVAFAPDGSRVATASLDGSARVFDAATGAELARLDHGDDVNAVVFAPDGTRVATGSDDGSARVFDAATGAELARLDHGDKVNAVAFAPDGTRVVTGSVNGSARVFDAATGAELADLDHDDKVNEVAFAPDGSRVATGSDDGSARVFDAATGAELARLDHNDKVNAVAFAPDGARVATGSVDGSARVFDAATGAELARLDHAATVMSVAFAPDGTRVATGSVDGSARVFDAATGAELARLDHDDDVNAVVFAPDGTRVATASDDSSARVFDAAPSAELARLDSDDWVRTVAFAPDGTRVATGSVDGSARVFDAATGAELARLDHDDKVSMVAFAPDGTRVATGSDDGSARVFDAATGAELARLDHDDKVNAVAFTPDGSRVATGSVDGSARVFDAATGAELARLDHAATVMSVAFAPDGSRVATGSVDGSARVFDAATGAELARLDHGDTVWMVAFGPDGDRVATGSDDGSARVFDAATGAELARLDHDGQVYSVAFAPDGSRIATGSNDRSARVFDAATGAELARLDQAGAVLAALFAPDGGRVVTASLDSSVRVFDAATGAELAHLDHNGPVWMVAFAPDGTRVVSGSEDGSARVFEIESDLLLDRSLKLMWRPLNAAELRRYSLPWNCRHVEQWSRVRAQKGDLDATAVLVDVLLSRGSDDALSEAERYVGLLADQSVLGAVAMRHGQYDRALAHWRQAARDGDTGAAINLAAIEGADGHVDESLALLNDAERNGGELDTAFGALIEQTATAAQLRRLEAAAHNGNTDAMNFLGVAAFRAGEVLAAQEYWSRSANLGDWAAPILLARSSVRTTGRDETPEVALDRPVATDD